jgi:hypothetical protein
MHAPFSQGTLVMKASPEVLDDPPPDFAFLGRVSQEAIPLTFAVGLQPKQLQAVQQFLSFGWIFPVRPVSALGLAWNMLRG